MINILFFVFLKTILLLPIIFSFTYISSEIFTDIDYSTKSTMRIIYELLLETFILFILVITSKCLSNYIISLFTKSVINHNISFSLLVSIIYSSLNKSYINKIKEIRHRINK